MPTKNLQNRVRVAEGNITKQNVDAIVNAANTTLLGGPDLFQFVLEFRLQAVRSRVNAELQTF
jgi:hypothetical protein